MHSAPFNRVFVKTSEGRHEYSLEQFLALPLHERVRYILQQRLEFFLGREAVDTKHALRSLRSMVDFGTPSTDHGTR